MIKFPGIDNIKSESLMRTGEIFMERQHGLTLAVWRKEEIRQYWTKEIFYPIHKKANILECIN